MEEIKALVKTIDIVAVLFAYVAAWFFVYNDIKSHKIHSGSVFWIIVNSVFIVVGWIEVSIWAWS